MDRREQVLERAEQYLRDHVRPQAAAIDADPEALREALKGLADRDLLALRRPEEYGGPELSEDQFRSFQETVARYSGALAFLQTQHQSAVSMIAKGANEAMKERVLPRAAGGDVMIGIGFSQLRRAGPPLLTAEPTQEGYRLTGHVPWVTGWTFYDRFLIGASLPDGSALFGLVPFEAREGRGGSIEFSPPMKLAAMESAQTVTADLDGWLMEHGDVSEIKPPGWIQRSDMINIVLQAFFALGCARGSLDVLEQVWQTKGLASVERAKMSLSDEVARCHREMTEIQAQADDTVTSQKLTLRAWAIDLAVRCAHAAIVASSGAANASDHPAQRLYREALVYSVSAQTRAIQEATLDRLVARGT